MTCHKLTIMTYNIWSNDIFSEERLTNLLTFIYYYNCDILCFQDVNIELFNKLIHNISLKYPYIISSPNIDKYMNNGLAIFSKYNIVEFFSNKLIDTNRDKYLLIAQIKKDDILYNIATFHLENEIENNLKIKQFNQILGALSQFNNCVLLGDTSMFTSEEELEYNKQIWSDGWIIDGSDEKKRYTLDYKNNIFVENNRSRTDRVFYKNKDFNLINFNLIGESYSPTPSSHFGLVTSVSLNNQD